MSIVYCGQGRHGEPSERREWSNGRPFHKEETLKRNAGVSDIRERLAAWDTIGQAWAMLRDVLGSRKAADRWAGEFWRQVLSRLPDEWVVTSEEIERWYRDARPLPVVPVIDRGLFDAPQNHEDRGSARSSVPVSPAPAHAG